jgi:hypothetical protein
MDVNVSSIRVVTLHFVIFVCLVGVGCISSTLIVPVKTYFDCNLPRTAISVPSNCSILSSSIVSFFIDPYVDPFASFAAIAGRHDLIGFY